MTEKQTVAGAYQKIDSHERECALRYKALEEGLGDLKQGAKAIIGLLIVVLGWFAVEAWNGQKEAVAAVHRPAPQAVATVGLPEKVLSFQGRDWQAQTVNRRMTP